MQRAGEVDNALRVGPVTVADAAPLFPPDKHAFLGDLQGEPSELKLLSFNLGLLRLKLAGVTVKDSPPHVSERFEHIPAALASCGADLIFLQEIYEEWHVRAVLAAAGPAGYTHHARGDTRSNKLLQFHNGLLVLSKVPIDAAQVLLHEQCSSLEKTFGSKSCLAVRVSTCVGKLCLVNMHTTAGGGDDPEANDVDTARESELREAVALCAQAACNGYAGVVVGDLNCGPEASSGNYEWLKQRGFSDALAPFNLGCTWDPSSPLNNLAVFAECPPQRIDHIFLPEQLIAGAGALMCVTTAERCFTEAPVLLRNGKAVTLSDHYGVRATLRRVSA